MYSRILLALALIGVTTGTSAQHVGTDFTIAFLRNFGPGNPQPTTNFSIFALEDATVTVIFSAPGNAQFQSQTIDVSADEVGVVSFPNSYLNQNNLFVAEQRSFKITSTAPIRVQAYQFRNRRSEGTPVLPISSLGSEYIVVNYRTPVSLNDPSQYNIIAVQDNTEITILPSSATPFGPTGTPINLTLNEGEVISLGSFQNTVDTKITSANDVPFAVFAGGEFMSFPSGCDAGGYMFEQMLPTSLWGTAHPIITTISPNIEGLVIVTLEPNTTVSFGCLGSFVLDTSCDKCSYKSDFGILTSSAPVSVAQINPNVGCGAPFDKGITSMRLLEPLSRGNTIHKFRSNSDMPVTGYNPITSFNVLHLALPNADTSGVLVNGNSVNGWIGSNSTPQAWAARVELGAINELTTIESTTPVWANYLALQPLDAITMSLGSNAQSEPVSYENLAIFIGDSLRLCQGDTTVLDPGISFPGLWQDGSVQSTFTVTEPGVYYVSYENQCPNSRDTVVVRPGIVFLELADQINACPGETVTLAPDTTRPFYTYQWAGQAEGTTLETNQIGAYTLTATNLITGCSIDAQINYIPFPFPPIELPAAIGLCPDDTIRVEAEGLGSWLWSTGDTLSAIHVSEAGTYTVNLTDSLGCIGSKSTQVFDLFLPFVLPEEYSVCDGESTEIFINSPNADVLWLDPPSENPATVGEGLWEIIASNECGLINETVFVDLEDCKCDAEVPNIFSPNADGRNDTFLPRIHCESTHYLLKIFNRWGTEIFTTLQADLGWDGRLSNGSEASEGVYYYVLCYRNDLRQDRAILNYSGALTLVRDSR